MKFDLRLLYLYLFSFVGLLIVTIGSIQLVNLGLKTVVFRDADKYEIYPTKIEGEEISREELMKNQERDLTRQRQRELSNSIAMIAIGLPLYLYHWKTIQKENKN